VGGVKGPLLGAGLGLIPAPAEIGAWHGLPGGDSYLSLDITVALPGLPAPAEPRDVVEFDRASGTFSLVFDGSAAGVPSSVRVDAVSQDLNGELLLSFDTTVALAGGVVADDEDLVRYDGVVYAMVFDGSAAGVASSTDLDGVHDIVTGPLLLMSFDTSGSVGGVVYDDEDVLEYDTATGIFTMFLDASATDPVDWPSADLAALPEAGAAGAVAGGWLVAGLAVWARRGRRRR